MYTVADYFHENAEKALTALRSSDPDAPPRQLERETPRRP
jgi:hypothetical protein